MICFGLQYLSALYHSGFDLWLSVYSIFLKLGSGPSSSHTVGPMRAAMEFTVKLEQSGLIDKIDRITTVDIKILYYRLF